MHGEGIRCHVNKFSQATLSLAPEGFNTIAVLLVHEKIIVAAIDS
jgi:hypothetical protein